MALSEMEKGDFPKRLVVEGSEDKYFVINLMRNFVAWPALPAPPPLWIEDRQGINQILKQGYLALELKDSNIRTLGVIVDADGNPGVRYKQIKDLVKGAFPDMPTDLNPGGLIIQNSDSLRFGVWLMPNNSSPGALEEFIEPMIPTEQEGLWELSSQCVTHAKSQNATFRDAHERKARLYTWLAWQDPPGYSPGNALMRKILHPQAEHCELFVKWFSDLFDLPQRSENPS